MIQGHSDHFLWGEDHSLCLSPQVKGELGCGVAIHTLSDKCVWPNSLDFPEKY